MRKRYDFENDPSSLDETIPMDLTRRNRNSIYSVPLYIGIGFLVYLLAIYGVGYGIDSILPGPLTVADEKTYPDSFITERAEHDLQLLTSIGPRVVGGYENEVLTVDFLQREIKLIIQQAHSNHKIELDTQVVSGAYYLDIKPSGEYNTYSNVQNVVVKISAKNYTQNSILVNSHFDSVPTSPGGSDDGINVVTMLEILRKISKSPDRPLHNIILLFNGAEETPLQAAHGFITQHKWAKGCKVVINLEAAGAGGKIILFQTGPQAPWLLNYYNKVPHPYGQVAGEEIFQSGLVPSDTDFRVFRDFGNMVGLDMAFFKNGYRYHTKFDDFQNIPLGSYQHVGDNALSLVRNLANAPELNLNQTESGSVVYFDVLGLFMVSYSSLAATLINSVTVLVSVILFLYNLSEFKLGFNKFTIRYLSVVLGAIILGWVASAVFVYCTALILDGINFTMSWYANPWIIFGLYVTPCLGLSSIFLIFVNHENLSLNIRCHMQVHVVRLIWSAILLLGTIFQIRSMYAILLPVFFSCVAFSVISVCRWQHTVRKWQLVYVVCMLFPTLLLMCQANTTFALFIPITGRFGSNRNPEVIVAILALFFTTLTTSYYVILVPLIRNGKYFFACLAAIFAITFVIILTPLGFPYSGNPKAPAPQRQWILHTGRVFHNENGDVEKSDAGIFLINLDRNSPGILKNYVKDLSKAKEINCDKYLLCGLPLPHIKVIQIMKSSTWIPANQPVIQEPLNFVVKSKELISPTILRYNISVSGPDRISVYLLPKENMKLVNIDLLDYMPKSNYLYNGRPLYYIWHTYGKTVEGLNFAIDMEIPENWNGTTTIDLSIAGIYVHDKKHVKTPYYVNFLKQFPDWTDVTAMLGSYSSWVI